MRSSMAVKMTIFACSCLFFLALNIDHYANMSVHEQCDNFLIFAQNIDRGYMLEPPHRGGSNEYPGSIFKSKIRK